MLEPGDLFTVTYGDEKSIEVTCLNLRKKRKLMDLVLNIQKGTEGVNPFELIEEALSYCVAELSEELLETLDETTAMEIVKGTLEGQTLSDEDKKKSESQPTS